MKMSLDNITGHDYIESIGDYGQNMAFPIMLEKIKFWLIDNSRISIKALERSC